MKQTSIISGALLMVMFFYSAGRAQSITTNTSAAGKIGKELSIDETASLHFGTMTIPTGAVNVTLSTTNVRTASSPGNITLLAQAPVSTNAAYSVFGDHYLYYDITLPANNVVTIVNGANHMHVNSFTAKSASQGNGTTGRLSSVGEDSFVVGATLVLSNGQAAGLYSGTFIVTVAYN